MISKKDQEFSKEEIFLYSLLNKVVNEYKSLLKEIKELKQTKPLKIVKILKISEIPGDTVFLVQLKNNRAVISLSAAEIISNYKLSDFSDFNANMVRSAVSGSLVDFLSFLNVAPLYKLESKFYDREKKKYFFTIKYDQDKKFDCSGEEILKHKKILSQMSVADVYDIAYTLGSEAIIRERLEILEINRGNFFMREALTTTVNRLLSGLLRWRNI